MRKLTAGLAALATGLALTACTGTTNPAGTTNSTGSTTTTGTSVVASLTDNVESHAQADDADYDASDATKIMLSDGASKASSAEGVAISGDVITISAPGTYVVSGSLSNGQIVVNSDAEGKVRIVLDGASVTSATGSAFVITAADEAVVVLAADSTNALTDGTGYDTTAEDAPNAALFSMADLTIGGTGELTVTGNTNDGIASKDGLVILGGTITVAAKDDGIRGKDYLIIADGTVAVTAEGDGLKSDNEDDDTVGYVLIEGGTVTVAAGDDGMHAEGDLAINGGTVTVSQSTEGLEGATVTIAGGATEVTASDDGLNATTGTNTDGGGMASDGALLTISGGTLVVTAEGDGLDSNGSLVITGGTTVVSGPTNTGNGALDSNGGITVSGGTLVAAGSAGMAETPGTESAQGWVAVVLDQGVAAGQTVSIVKDGTVIASYTTVKQVQSLVVSDPDIKAGESYDVYVGGKLAGDTVGTYSDSGDISGATKTTSVTAGEGASTGMGGMGGGRGGGRRP